MKVFLALSLIIAVASAGTITRVKRFRDKLMDPQLAGRITNGEIANQGQFPYQVGLKLHVGEKTGYCGGTIISDRYILTAAHCSDFVDGTTVILGATRMLDSSEAHQESIYISKSNIFVHEDWNPDILRNDIALLKSPVVIRFNEYIQPASLPKKDAGGQFKNYVGEMVYASGWGLESDEAETISEVLRWIEVPVISKTRCSLQYLGTITDNMICISTSDKKSTCSGDSGGPLVYKDGDVNTVIGATSFGLAFGCEIGWPGVFTRISSYVDWIHEKTGIPI